MTVWHIVRRQTEWNLTNSRYHLTHCQMTGWVEPDKLKILFHTLSDNSLTHCQATDWVNWTNWRYHLTHCQMTGWGEPDKQMISVDTPWDDRARWVWQKVTMLLLTRWTTRQGTGWLCWPPKACGPQRCSPWSYSGETKLTMRTPLQMKMLLTLN